MAVTQHPRSSRHLLNHQHGDGKEQSPFEDSRTEPDSEVDRAKSLAFLVRWRNGREAAYCSWNLKGIVYKVATGLLWKTAGVIRQVASALSIAPSSVGIDLMILQSLRAPVVVMTHLAISVP
jgi:hypothetical protein